MKLDQILQEMFQQRRFNKPSIANQTYGGVDDAWDVDDIFAHITANKGKYKIQQIPLKWLIELDNTLEGESDEEDGSVEFRKRVKGIDANAFLQGNYPPVLIVKADPTKRSTKYDNRYHVKDSLEKYYVADGRHRILQFVHLLKTLNKNPKSFSIRGYVIDEKELNDDKIPSIGMKNEIEINKWRNPPIAKQ